MGSDGPQAGEGGEVNPVELPAVGRGFRQPQGFPVSLVEGKPLDHGQMPAVGHRGFGGGQAGRLGQGEPSPPEVQGSRQQGEEGAAVQEEAGIRRGAWRQALPPHLEGSGRGSGKKAKGLQAQGSPGKKGPHQVGGFQRGQAGFLEGLKEGGGVGPPRGEVQEDADQGKVR